MLIKHIIIIKNSYIIEKLFPHFQCMDLKKTEYFFKLFRISCKTKIKNSNYFYQSRENVLLRKVSLGTH